MNKIYHKLLKYKNFQFCINSYPYFEDSNNEGSVCKERIKKDIKDCLIAMEIKGWNIYTFQSSKPLLIDEFLSDKFLFYSTENTIEEKFYIISQSKRQYKDLDDWYNNGSDEIIISNDFDGLGLWIIGKKKSLVYLMNVFREKNRR